MKAINIRNFEQICSLARSECDLPYMSLSETIRRPASFVFMDDDPRILRDDLSDNHDETVTHAGRQRR